MRIARTGRFVFVAQWFMIVLLPLFFFLGRGLVGAAMGWLAVLGVVYGIVVIIVLALPPVMTLFDRTVRRGRATRLGYDISSLVLWAAFVLAALTVSDAADGPPLDSALTAWTGGAVSQQASAAIFAVTAMLIGLAYLATFVFAALGIARWRRPFDA